MTSPELDAGPWVVTRTDRIPMTVNEVLAAIGAVVAAPKARGKSPAAMIWPIRAEIRNWRAWGQRTGARALAARADRPLPGPYRLTWTHLRPTRQIIDVGAPALVAKAMLDGLVESGLLPGDDYRWKVHEQWTSPEFAGYHGLRLTIIRVPVDEQLTLLDTFDPAVNGARRG